MQSFLKNKNASIFILIFTHFYSILGFFRGHAQCGSTAEESPPPPALCHI